MEEALRSASRSDVDLLFRVDIPRVIAKIRKDHSKAVLVMPTRSTEEECT